MASNSSSGEGSSSQTIKIAVLVIALLCAGYFFYRAQKGGGGQLDTPESATLYVCPKDGETLNVTPADFEEMLKSGDAGAREGAGARERGLFVRCPKCKQRVMVEGVKCQKDGTVFARFNAAGDPAACPKCSWKPAT